MSVTVAKTAGFCFGVRRAVELAEQQAEENGTIWAYGEIIHNMHEIRRLEKLRRAYRPHAGRDPGRGAGADPRAWRAARGLPHAGRQGVRDF